MTKSKTQLESKTIVASIVGLGATIAQMFNVMITPEEQAAIIAGILAIVQLGGFIATWYGRLKAEHKIR